MWPLRCLGRGPLCPPAPQSVKGLTPPTVTDTRGGACSLSKLAIALGHRRGEGLKTASVPSVNGGALIANRTKMGRKASRHRTNYPGARWLLGTCRVALDLWRGLQHRCQRALGCLGQACEGASHTRHVTAGNQICSFKQHLKYSLGEPKAKYGMACECPVQAF